MRFSPYKIMVSTLGTVPWFLLLVTGLAAQTSTNESHPQNPFPAVKVEGATKTADEQTLGKIALTSHDPVAAATAVQEIRDQAILAKIANSTVVDWSVGESAVKRIDDQTLLAATATNKLLTYSVRLAAAERLENQALLAKVFLQLNSKNLQKVVLPKLNDRDALGSVAMQAVFVGIAKGDDESFGLAALHHITSQASLAAITQNAGTYGVTAAAYASLTDKVLVARLAADRFLVDVPDAPHHRVPWLEVHKRVADLAAFDAWDKGDLVALAGLTNYDRKQPEVTTDSVEALARIKQVLALPAMSRKSLGIKLNVTAEKTTSPRYTPQPGCNGASFVDGESVTFELRRGSEVLVASQQWQTSFPEKLGCNTTFVYATVNVSDLIVKLLEFSQLSSEELAGVAHASIPEAQLAATLLLSKR